MTDILENTLRKQRCSYFYLLLSAINIIPLLKEGIFIASAMNDDNFQKHPTSKEGQEGLSNCY